MQNKTIITGFVKVSSISQNIARHSDPRLAWLMIHKISNIYIDIRKQEIEEAT